MIASAGGAMLGGAGGGNFKPQLIINDSNLNEKQ